MFDGIVLLQKIYIIFLARLTSPDYFLFSSCISSESATEFSWESFSESSTYNIYLSESCGHLKPIWGCEGDNTAISSPLRLFYKDDFIWYTSSLNGVGSIEKPSTARSTDEKPSILGTRGVPSLSELLIN